MPSPSAAWTGSVPDWSPGDTITETLMDDISSKLMFLKNRTYDVVTVATTTTTSATFVAMTGASITLTNTSGGRVVIWFNATVTNSGVQNVFLDFGIDGTRQGDTTNGLGYIGISTGSLRQMATLWFLTDTAPSAGSHTYAVYWKTSGGTATIDATNCQFGVMDFA